jgi:hypothetical protein
MSPRGVTGRRVVKNCGEDRTDAKYNANLGNNYIHKLNYALKHSKISDNSLILSVSLGLFRGTQLLYG